MSPRAKILPLTRPRVHKFFLDQFDILGVPWEIANIVRKSDHRGLRLKCGRHGRTPWRRSASLQEQPQSQCHSQRKQGTTARLLPVERETPGAEQILVFHFFRSLVDAPMSKLLFEQFDLPVAEYTYFRHGSTHLFRSWRVSDQLEAPRATGRPMEEI